MTTRRHGKTTSGAVAIWHMLRGHTGEALLCDECRSVPDPPTATGWSTYWRGRRRLRFGWCPRCNSSPPRPDCDVCEGTYEYGPALTPARRLLWRARWEAYRRGQEPSA